jgi:hypothetical protein
MEVAGHRVFTMPYTNIYALVEEMVAIENPTQISNDSKSF